MKSEYEKAKNDYARIRQTGISKMHGEPGFVHVGDWRHNFNLGANWAYDWCQKDIDALRVMLMDDQFEHKKLQERIDKFEELRDRPRHGSANQHIQDVNKQLENGLIDRMTLVRKIEKLTASNKALIDIMWKIDDEVGHSERKDVPIIRGLCAEAIETHGTKPKETK